MKKYDKFVEEYKNRGYFASVFGEDDLEYTLFDINGYIVTVYDLTALGSTDVELWIEVEKDDESYERIVEKTYKNVKCAINKVDSICK
jgi:hypothetical protein